MTYNYKLIIAYDGTDFCGWQIQPHATSIQSTIEQALFVCLKQEIRLIGAGRTDAGVHAKGQVAHFKFYEPLDLQRLKRSLNGLLCSSIRIIEIQEAPPTFHAQKSAISKEYHYQIALEETVLPFDKPYVWHMRHTLNRTLLTEAASLFLGKHNFSAFANAQDKGAASKNPYRTIFRLDRIDTDYGIRLEFEGNGFLYKMVRNITGMLVSVATGKRPLHDISMLLQGAPRSLADKAAPPHGLFLIRVSYSQ